MKRADFKSNIEFEDAKYLRKLGVEWSYEPEKIPWVQPAKQRKYTPDFVIVNKDGSKLYIERKGKWSLGDRQKHLELLKLGLDIRLVFQKDNTIQKNSETTYTMWCAKKGIPCAVGDIPKEWLKNAKKRVK